MVASVFEGLSLSSGLANPSVVWALVQRNKRTRQWRVARGSGGVDGGTSGKR